MSMKAKYSPKLVDEIVKYMEEGLTNKDAIQLVGISEESFYKWQRPTVIIDGKDVKNKDYKPELVESIKKAELKRKKALINKIITEKSWQAAAWYLERVFPDEFKERRQYDVAGISPQEKIKRTMDLIEEQTKESEKKEEAQEGEIVNEQVSTDGGDALQEQGGEAVSTDGESK